MFAQVCGQSLVGAVTISAAVTFGGLIAWAIYHTISRRNDGMVILMLALLLTVPSTDQIALSLMGELTRRAVPFILLAIISVAVGLFYRERRKGEQAMVPSPLWDADVDPPTAD